MLYVKEKLQCSHYEQEEGGRGRWRHTGQVKVATRLWGQGQRSEHEGMCLEELNAAVGIQVLKDKLNIFI